MTDVWLTIGGLFVATVAIKAAGPLIVGGRELPHSAYAVIGLLAPHSERPVFGQSETQVTLSSLALDVGEPGVIEASIECPAGCGRFLAELRYDPAVVQVQDVFAGPYLGADVVVSESTIDNAQGVVRLAAEAQAGPDEAQPVLFLLNVSGAGNGVTPLAFSQLEVTDLNGSPLAVTSEVGRVSVVQRSNGGGRFVRGQRCQRA
jgi:hypothetical protein